MVRPLREKRLYEFGPFRLDASIPVLVRNGDIVALTPKALDTLLVLLQSAGNVVDKETLMQAVWPASFVEESNLAQHISALRKAVGDTDGAAIRIDTIPKRGYRFVGKVKEISEDTSLSDRETPQPGVLQAYAENGDRAPATALPAAAPGTFSWRWLTLAGAIVAGLAALAFGIHFNLRSTRGAPQWKQRQLTANTEEDPVLRSALSPDGKYLAYSDQAGIHAMVVDTGESRLLRSPENLCFR